MPTRGREYPALAGYLSFAGRFFIQKDNWIRMRNHVGRQQVNLKVQAFAPAAVCKHDPSGINRSLLD